MSVSFTYFELLHCYNALPKHSRGRSLFNFTETVLVK